MNYEYLTYSGKRVPLKIKNQELDKIILEEDKDSNILVIPANKWVEDLKNELIHGAPSIASGIALIENTYEDEFVKFRMEPITESLLKALLKTVNFLREEDVKLGNTYSDFYKTTKFVSNDIVKEL